MSTQPTTLSRWQQFYADPAKRQARRNGENSRRAGRPLLSIPFPLGPNWHTVEYVAALLGKHRNVIDQWCREGFLIECGYKVLKLENGRFRRWWIFVPPEHEARLASSQHPPALIDSLPLAE